MFFGDTYCTYQWLSNSAFFNSGWHFSHLIKIPLIKRPRAGLQHPRESLQAPPPGLSVAPSDSGPALLVSLASYWSFHSLCCPGDEPLTDGCSAQRSLFPQGRPTGQPRSGLCTATPFPQPRPTAQEPAHLTEVCWSSEGASDTCTEWVISWSLFKNLFKTILKH